MNTINHYDHNNSQRVATRKERNQEIIDTVRRVCNKQGGMSIIGEGFVVVDTKLFKVGPK